MDEKIRKALGLIGQPVVDIENEDDPEEDDDRCDLDPDKICDNCMMCLTGGADFRAITIEGIALENELKDK